MAPCATVSLPTPQTSVNWGESLEAKGWEEIGLWFKNTNRKALSSSDPDHSDILFDVDVYIWHSTSHSTCHFSVFLWHFTWNIFWCSIWQFIRHGPWGPVSWRASHRFQVRLWGETTWVTKNSTHQEIAWSPDSVRGGFQKDFLVHRTESGMNPPGHHWGTRFSAWCLDNHRGPPWEKHP